jgi:hypothetical protein
MTKEELKVMIDSTINTNGARHITGKSLNLALNAIVDSMGQRSDEEGLQRSDVNFFDYDGTLLYAYTWEEAKELTELPELPVHSGLTVEGWNYTLEDIKEQGCLLLHFGDDGTLMKEGEIVINNVTYDFFPYENQTAAAITLPNAEVGDAYFNIELNSENGAWELSLNDDGSVWQDIILDREDKIGKADVGAVVYDSDGEQVIVSNVVIIPRGDESVGYEYRHMEIITVLSVSNTVSVCEERAFNRCYFPNGVVMPKSVKYLSSSGYAAFYDGRLKSFYWNGLHDKWFGFSQTELENGVLEIPFGVSYVNYSPGANDLRAPYIKFPSTVSYLDGIGGQSYPYMPYVFDFRALKDVPSIGSAYYASEALNIVVPDELYESWISDTNWPELAERIFKASEVPQSILR